MDYNSFDNFFDITDNFQPEATEYKSVLHDGFLRLDGLLESMCDVSETTFTESSCSSSSSVFTSTFSLNVTLLLEGFL